MAFVTLTEDGRQTFNIEDNVVEEFIEGRDFFERYLQHESRLRTILVSGYNFERLLADETLKYMWGIADFLESPFLQASVNSVVLAFLSAVRAYHDHIANLFDSSFLVGTDVAPKTKDIFNLAHTNNFEYRLVEKLRNIAQHSGISEIRVSSDYSAPEHEKYLIRRLNVVIARDSLLARADKLKARLRDEIQEHAYQSYDIKYLFAKYTELIMQCHEQVRELVARSYDRAGNASIRLKEKVECKAGKPVNGLIRVKTESGSTGENDTIVSLRDPFWPSKKLLDFKPSNRLSETEYRSGARDEGKLYSYASLAEPRQYQRKP